MDIHCNVLFALTGFRNKLQSWKEWKLSYYQKFSTIYKCGVYLEQGGRVERGRDKFLISSEQWNSLEQWSLNKFFTSKYLLPNEKYEQHSSITTCSHLFLLKLMILFLDVNVLLDFSHTLICSLSTLWRKCLFI